MTTTIPADAELLEVDPATLEIGDNVRTEASIGKAFAASIATHGVLQPLTATRRADGTIVVRDGQRRTLAARAAGLATVRVVVTPEADADTTAREAERIAQQFTLNQDRDGLTGRDQLGAIEQMLNLGVTPAKAAKRLNVARSTVDAAVVTAKSTLAREQVEDGALTLEHAAVLAEFEDNERDTDRILHVCSSNPNALAHVAQQIRDRRAADARRAEAGKPYADQGFHLLAEQPYTYRDNGLQYLRWLTRTDTGEQATVEDITDPRQWSVFLAETHHHVDRDTGAVVDEDEVDWDVDVDDPDEEPSPGLRHPATVEVRIEWEPSYYCTDLDNIAELTGRAWTGGSSATETEEQAEARKLAEAAQRRQVIVNNKAARAAETVRAEWLRTLFTRKTPPKIAAQWVATRLAVDPEVLTAYNSASDSADKVAAELLDVDKTKLTKGEICEGASEGRAQVITLARVVAGYEIRARRNSWRATSYDQVAQYMRFLRDLGYTLAPIEEVIAGERNSDTITLPD